MIYTLGQLMDHEAKLQVGDVVVYEGFRLVIESHGSVAVKNDDDPDSPGEPLIWFGAETNARAVGRAAEWVDAYVRGYDDGFRAGELGRIASEVRS